MPTVFAADAALALETIDFEFGEELRLEGYSLADPNSRSAADPDRPPFVVRGVFSAPSTSARSAGRGFSNTSFHEMVRPYPSVVLHTVLPWRPRKGDRLIRVEGDRPYQIAEVHILPQGQTRLELVA